MNISCRRAFTLAEFLIMVTVIVILIGILLPAIGHRGRHGGPNVYTLANLRSLNTGAANYAGDQDDQIFAYTWIDDGSYSSIANPNPPYPRMNPSGQAQNIIQRGTGRIKGHGKILKAPSQLLYLRYSHQVLLDYLTDRQPEPIAASPFDKNLIGWQENPLGYLDAKSDVPYWQGMPKKAGYDMDPMWTETAVKQLWPFGSSYQVVPHAWVDDENPQYTPSADSPHHMVKGDSDELLGGRKMTEVKFPSQKVFMYEEFDRFSSKKGIYAAYPEAKINMAFFDGSVRQELVGDANSAFDEGNPDGVWEQRYVPLDTFPVPMGGLGELTKLDLRFRWTKGGLGGVDFGGE